jgi:hypothetical protein
MPIKRCNQVKYLGVYIDESLSCKPASSIIAKQLSPFLHIMARLRKTLPFSALNIFHKSIFLSRWMYTASLASWRFASTREAFMRIYYKSFAVKYYCTMAAAKRRNQNPYQHYVIYARFVLLYKIIRLNSCPALMQEITSSSNYNLRRIARVKITRPRLELQKQSIDYWGPRLWNLLPESIAGSSNISHFKNQLRNWIESHSHQFEFC